MNTKTVSILFARNGEYSSTLSPVKEFDGDESVLQEKRTFVNGPDDWQPHTAAAFVVKAVTLPAWLEVDEWIRREHTWRVVWKVAGHDWTETESRGLADIYEEDGVVALYTAARLLKTRSFRSAFRESLAEQLRRWIETPKEERKYRSPFSARQWNALIVTADVYEARRIEEALYAERAYMHKFEFGIQTAETVAV